MPRKKKINADWILVNGSVVTCHHCGEKKDLSEIVPIPSDDFLDILNGFLLIHQHCKKNTPTVISIPSNV